MSASEGVAPLAPMSICGSCGVIAPSEADRCDACKAPLPADGRPSVAPREDGRYWIQVRAQFKCKHCEKRSPVNHVDVDGTFTCLRCNRDQGADAGIWQTGLRFCHEVADLAGPDPEGRHAHPEVRIGDANKWADIGVSRTRARMDFTETQMSAGAIRLRSLFLHARPGVPLCDGCHAPLEVTVGQAGRLETRCPGCHRSARYEVDPKASRMERGFVGAICDDHRSDRPATDAAPSKPGAPVAIACPGCGAALDLAAKDHFVTCTYCRTPSKIPSRLRAQLFTEGVELEPMWLMFEGPSRARGKLEKKAIAAKKRAAEQRARKEERPRSESAAPRRAEEPTGGAGGMRRVVMLILAIGVLGGLAHLMLR